MLVLYGIHRLNDRRTGYRNDYCLSCERQSLAERFRSQDVGHIFFVPLLPLGYRERWQCRTCGSDPHARVHTSKTLKIVAAAVALLPVALSFLTPQEINQENTITQLWEARAVFTCIFLLFLFWIRMGNNYSVGLKEALKNVAPASADRCFYCNNWLSANSYCASCDVNRLEL